MGNPCFNMFSCCEEQNDIERDNMPEVEGMQHVEDLIAYMDQIMNKIDRGEQGQVSKPISVASSIKSGGDLMEKFSKRLNRYVSKKCLLSTLDRQSRALVIDVLKQAQHVKCVGIALSIIAHMLERIDQASSNKDECLRLLRYMSVLAKHMKNLNVHLDRPKLDDILLFIVKGTLMCQLQMQPNNLCRFISAPVDNDDLKNLESQLVHSYWDLEFEALTAVLRMLPIVPGPSQGEYPHTAVGIEEAQNEVIKLLDLGEPSHRVVAIYGIGGIGKTTLATAVFNSLDLTGYHHCRVDMDQESKQSDLQAIQEQILRDLFEENLKLNNCTEGRRKLSEAFQKASTPVFLFIDNALRQTDLEMLLPIERLSCLPVLSRILITTRNLYEINIFRLQEGIQVHSRRVDSLSGAEAKRLLCYYALGDLNGSFDPDVNIDGLLQICGNIPLVLRIVGFKLGTDRNLVSACNEILEYHKEWQRKGLEGGEEDLSERIVDFVYRRLKGPSKEAFLDIAFFFYDWKRSKVADIVGEMPLQDLEGAALVTTSEEDKVKIHDIVRARGRKLSDGNRITDRQSLSILLRDAQKLQQTKGIWLPNDYEEFSLEARHVDSMSRSLRVLSLGNSTRVNGRCETAFEDMRFLRISYEDMLPMDLSKSRQLAFFQGHLKGHGLSQRKFTINLPDSLRLLYLGAHLSNSPLSLDIYGHFTSLRELQLSNIIFENFETSIRFGNISSLKTLKLYNRSKLETLPENFGNLFSMQDLDISNCSMLKKLPESFGNLSSMKDLNMNYCSMLERLPENFGNLSCLQRLYMFDCSKLERFPESFGNLSSLQILYMCDFYKLERLPDSFGNLSSLETLYMFDCSKLKRLPESFGNLSSMRDLDASNCSMLHRLPESFGNLSSLQTLRMCDCSQLEGLPDSFGNLSSLQVLRMDDSSKLERLPESFGNLCSMQYLNMNCCSMLERLPESIGNLSSLQDLNMNYCSILERLPESFGNLSSLQRLYMFDCSKLETLPESFGNLSSMQDLDISNCSRLEGLPKSFGNLTSLQILYMLDCSMLKRLPESFGNLSSMRDLDTTNCSMLSRLPENFGNLSSLQTLRIGDCSKLERLPESFGNLSSMRDLDMSNCSMLERLPESFGNLSSMRDLNMNYCSKLKRLPESFGNLTSLQRLYIFYCLKLEKLPDSFGNLSSIRDLNMNYCSMLGRLPESFGNLSSLKRLYMFDCFNLERLPESFGNLFSMVHLDISNCSMLERLPESFGNLFSLQTFRMGDCSNLKRLPESFGNLSSLQTLIMVNCSKLETLPESFGNLSSMRDLDTSNCSMLARLPESFGNLSSLQRLYMFDCSKLERLPQSFDQLSCLQTLNMDGCQMICSLFDTFEQLKCLKFLCISNCKELKRLPEDIVFSTSLASMKAYGCTELEAKTMDSLVEVRSLMFLEMGESPMLIKRWEEIQHNRPLIGAAPRFDGGNYPYVEIMSTIFFSCGTRLLQVNGDGQLAAVSSPSFLQVGVKVGLLLTASDLSNELRQKLLEVASPEFQMIYVDVEAEGEGEAEAEAEGSSWMEERNERIRKTMMQLPEGSCAWTSPFRKTSLLFAYSLWRFTGCGLTSIVGTSVLMEEEGRRKLSNPLEMMFRTETSESCRVDLTTLFYPISTAWELMPNAEDYH